MVPFFLFLILPGLLYAQSPYIPENSILLVVFEDDDTATGMLGDVIVDSMALEFLINDFRVRVSEKTDGEGFSNEESVRESLIDEALESGSLFLLEGRYRIVEDSVVLGMECLRVARAASIYSGREEFPVDLNLDNAIQEFIRNVIVSIQNDLRDNPPEKISDLSDEEAVPDEVVPSRNQVVSSGRSGNKITTTAELGSVIPVGESSDYFDLGYVPALSAHYPVSLPYGTLELGAYISLNYINAEGQLNSSQNLLFFFAPLVRYRIPLGERFACSFRLAAGGTLLMVNRNSEGYQGVLIPALQTGVGGEFAFRDLWGVLWGADLSLSFEQSITITGIQPSIGVYYKL